MGNNTELKAVPLPKDGRVELTRADSHILLKGLRKVLVGYERFPLTLKFEKAGEVEVEVMVEERE